MGDELPQPGCFPVMKSLVCVEALARTIEAAYGLREVQCQLLQATMRDVYHVRTIQNSFVLFLYRHQQRTAAEITAEWDLVAYLKAGGAPAAPAIRQENGELLLKIPAPEGICYAVLATFVEGDQLRRRYSVEAVRRYGKAIARIHTLADGLHLKLPRACHDFNFVVVQSLQALEPVMGHRPADMAYLHQAAAILRNRFEALPRQSPEYGIIHGDVIRANAQVSPGGDITVLDFDLCGWGWRAYDAASYLEVAEGEEARQAFLAGYQEIRRLTEEELSWLPLFGAARHIFSLGVPALNLYHWGRAYLTEEMIEADLQGLRRCMETLTAV